MSEQSFEFKELDFNLVRIKAAFPVHLAELSWIDQDAAIQILLK